ncbi:Calponin homology domain [Pseudocohnilembus persalinus]|uniref:Calponin homology domain n=1 Tax=Pseudocohnilembus persalinus TaxID=266149 RepID=A0A0V0QN95_PSEPJ|nr:Calponin homology domain [Pseudocohnilembus persalinus]|eukprot:KRX03755.1 Calponin homology domain [Pseudocohnilembus persalinus]
MNEAFGIMDQAYFVGKKDILNWVNNLLQLNLEKVEQLGTGSAWCQIMDVMEKDCVQLSKVNWNANSEYQYVNNFKLLQKAFQSKKLKKFIERFYEINCGDRGSEYNAVERRKQASNNQKMPVSIPSSIANLSKPKTVAQRQPLAPKINVQNSVNKKRTASEAEQKESSKYEQLIKKVKQLVQENSEDVMFKLRDILEIEQPQEQVQIQQQQNKDEKNEQNELPESLNEQQQQIQQQAQQFVDKENNEAQQQEAQ